MLPCSCGRSGLFAWLGVPDHAGPVHPKKRKKVRELCMASPQLHWGVAAAVGVGLLLCAGGCQATERTEAEPPRLAQGAKGGEHAKASGAKATEGVAGVTSHGTGGSVAGKEMSGARAVGGGDESFDDLGGTPKQTTPELNPGRGGGTPGVGGSGSQAQGVSANPGAGAVQSPPGASGAAEPSAELRVGGMPEAIKAVPPWGRLGRGAARGPVRSAFVGANSAAVKKETPKPNGRTSDTPKRGELKPGEDRLAPAPAGRP